MHQRLEKRPGDQLEDGAGHGAAHRAGAAAAQNRGGVKAIARIVGNRDWAVGDRFSLGDIAAGTVTGYLSVRFEFE